MQYSTIPFGSHVTQATAQLEQGLDEILDMYLHCTNGLHFQNNSINHKSNSSNKFQKYNKTGWTETVENAAQISCQDTLCTAFSKMTGSQLSSANTLNA